MAIHECPHCRMFASLGPGLCWKCGHRLVPKAFDDGPPPPPPPGVPPQNQGSPQKGGLIYRCKSRRHFASLTPGACLLCGGPTEAGSGDQLRDIAQAVERIGQGMKQAQRVINELVQQALGVRNSLSYNMLPSFLFSVIHGSPMPGILARLVAERQKLLGYANELRRLRDQLQRSGLPGSIQTISTIGTMNIARDILEAIDLMLNQIMQQLEILDKAVAKLS